MLALVLIGDASLFVAAALFISPALHKAAPPAPASAPTPAEQQPAAPAPAPSHTFDPHDLFGLEAASDPQISPDGRRIAYVRRAGDILTDRMRQSI